MPTPKSVEVLELEMKQMKETINMFSDMADEGQKVVEKIEKALNVKFERSWKK